MTGSPGSAEADLAATNTHDPDTRLTITYSIKKHPEPS